MKIHGFLIPATSTRRDRGNAINTVQGTAEVFLVGNCKGIVSFQIAFLSKHFFRHPFPFSGPTLPMQSRHNSSCKQLDEPDTEAGTWAACLVHPGVRFTGLSCTVSRNLHLRGFHSLRNFNECPIISSDDPIWSGTKDLPVKKKKKK